MQAIVKNLKAQWVEQQLEIHKQLQNIIKEIYTNQINYHR